MGIESNASNDAVQPAAAAAAKNEVDFASVMGHPAANMTAAADKPADAAPADPRVAIHDRISSLYGVVEQEEADKGKKNSWVHGEHLRELGSLYMQTGDKVDGRLCLHAASDVLHNAPDKPANGELAITESLVDYGRSLLQPMGRQSLASRQHDLNDADQIFGAVVDRAKLEHRSPEDIAAMLQLKADADIASADTYKTGDVTGKTAYLADMQKASTALTSGLDLLNGRTSNDTRLSAARLHAELGFVDEQRNRVDDRNNWYNSIWGAGMFNADHFDAAGEYKKSIDAWHQFKPQDGQQAVVKDEELLTTLARYDQLSKKEGSKDNAAAAERETQAIMGNHPNWQLKM